MTKKDYEAFAEILNYTYQKSAQYLKKPDRLIEHLAEDIATILAEDNPRFDRERFLTACGMTEYLTEV